jgi:hypothetical protein
VSYPRQYPGLRTAYAEAAPDRPGRYSHQPHKPGWTQRGSVAFGTDGWMPATTQRNKLVPDWSGCTALSPGCTRRLISSAQARALRSGLVRETPIYEQLRSEAITTDATPSKTAPPRGARSGRHRQPAQTTGLLALCPPPGPSADLMTPPQPAAGHADQRPGAPQRTAAPWRLPATLAHPTHARPTRTASSVPSVTGADDW